MTGRNAESRAGVQWWALAMALVVALALASGVIEYGRPKLGLFTIGIVLGATLYHAAFGFTDAWRRAMVSRDLSGVTAQLLMLAVAIVLFAPGLEQGDIFGRKVSGAVAPVGLSMVFGAFLFGIGMQLGNGCASGTLFAAGGGSVRMVLVLVFFCAGAFWGSLDLHWWHELPGIGSVSLGEGLGWKLAVSLELVALLAIWLALRVFVNRAGRPLWPAGGMPRTTWLRGPWPLLLAALLLAGLNWLTLATAGHAWSITWGFSLWAAKVAAALGWDPASSTFWDSGFQARALGGSLLRDNVSVMNFGLLLGAFAAASLAGAMRPSPGIALRPLLAAVIGGLAMGYGARLAYGCNIGALFSGIASGSLHGWVWLLAAIPGNAIGVWLRPIFSLQRQ
ncbi:MAG: YeeE/YedE family protein [Alphaproteobacteria bacterium]|nr:YeeE/YedE family protein [Alphaproteobacteria bacterium]MDP6238750.1 YeeE/YedE family protein [Alphaproteobacteria bacterium]MDP7173881.1 YeeE/YedE family protein [Alphaproteobacteria bacterium]MDP7233097.1 YeeE/YedE family protein [Alphaproteobacteria bacterium]MDP7487843.1 YeeE/YedE family protein [Alphaproteobacteria bacterium]|tara:strand:- start:2296 stop:3474 length:1179 start_codon:yes stop_codon:yes gene_type:complete